MRARVAVVCLAILGLSAISAMVAAPATAAPGVVSFKARIDGRDISSIDANKPLRLSPDQQVIVDLSVTNNGTSDLSIRSVNLNGKVMGLTFFSFETRIDLVVPPGQTLSRTFAIELIGLKGQATGLVPGALHLLDARRQVVAARGFAIDVRGSLSSVYGVFGLLVAAITGLLFVGVIVRLAANRLSVNRWSRAVQFAIPGLGVGLTLTFSLSAFRVLLPKATSWLTIVAVTTIALFIVGYLTPTPSDDAADYDDEGAEEEPELAVAAPRR